MKCNTYVLSTLILFFGVAGQLPFASAGHHFESKMAQQHPQYDLTDVYAFRATEPGKTVLFPRFGKNGLYNFHFGFDRELKKGRTFTF